MIYYLQAFSATKEVRIFPCARRGTDQSTEGFRTEGDRVYAVKKT